MKCVVFGAGKSGKNYVKYKHDDVDIVAVVDNSVEKHGHHWLGDYSGYIVNNPEAISAMDYDTVIICSARWEEIEDQLIRSGVELSKIVYEESIYPYRYSEFYAYRLWHYYSEIHSFEILSAIALREYRYYRYMLDDRTKGTDYIMVDFINTRYDEHLSTFNDKIRYLEIHNYGNLERMCADKYEVRKYVEYCGLAEILNELYFVADSLEDIDYSVFPEKFVLKLNNGCGFNIICENKNELTMDDIVSKTRRWELRKIEMLAYEWHYEGIRKRYICEKLLESPDGRAVEDYKYFCCNGRIVCILVCVDRDMATLESYHYYYNKEWEYLDYATDSVKQTPHKDVLRPKNLEKMNKIAETLAKPFPFVRVDLYNIDGRIVFGELTFTPCGGLITIQSDEAQVYIGEQIDVDYNLGVNEKIYNDIVRSVRHD